MTRKSWRCVKVKAGPLFQFGTNRAYGLTDEQLAEWDQWLLDRRPRAPIHL
jgi:hypothetical protein